MVVRIPETQVIFPYYSPNEHIPLRKHKHSALTDEKQNAQKSLHFNALSLKQ